MKDTFKTTANLNNFQFAYFGGGTRLQEDSMSVPSNEGGWRVFSPLYECIGHLLGNREKGPARLTFQGDSVGNERLQDNCMFEGGIPTCELLPSGQINASQ
jgi:hypothetical protein